MKKQLTLILLVEGLLASGAAMAHNNHGGQWKKHGYDHSKRYYGRRYNNDRHYSSSRYRRPVTVYKRHGHHDRGDYYRDSYRDRWDDDGHWGFMIRYYD